MHNAEPFRCGESDGFQGRSDTAARFDGVSDVNEGLFKHRQGSGHVNRVCHFTHVADTEELSGELPEPT